MITETRASYNGVGTRVLSVIGHCPQLDASGQVSPLILAFLNAAGGGTAHVVS